MATKTDGAPDIRKRFEQAGFTVASVPGSPGALELKKSNFASYLSLKDGRWVRSGSPYFVIRGVNYELEDRGYQKFWFSKADDERVPVRRKTELTDLHRFDEEVRYVLGQTDLYNEALGSTNARTVYDRLNGRPDL